MITVIPQKEMPTRLADLRDPPKQLYVRGDPACLDMPSLAIVGSRACSHYGHTIARVWAAEIAEKGVVIVSGLARGIDGYAHYGALDAEGLTVAVLGCGIDRDYPASHKELAAAIEEAGGAIVSEYEPGVEPRPWRFPARNRIIAGLADVTLVIEARERSGSLITAEFAIEMERPVLVVPGDISERTSGSNQLLREQRAHVVLSPGDVIGWMESLHLLSEYKEGAP
jgi:DNA processing protein